ncbi:MAG: hypothetical protein MRERV_22c026 [Mycoplasmataceae bacterium RV_VA103A]|nr:MAG: hypothetical protein MRERV_22c026 [Mycoplasmataceae bacterium RV_VA103A]
MLHIYLFVIYFIINNIINENCFLLVIIINFTILILNPP